MRKLYWIAALLFVHTSLKSQIITGEIFGILQQAQVTLYENPNYNGAFKTLAPGSYVLTDFNDVASSIKVPAGLVAYIYDHASPEKGFGISVDLLEDVPNLNVYDFNDRVSYVTVFASTKDDKYVWARNAMVNGQFVPGHWERKRATPVSYGTVGVVSPPIEGPLPSGPTVLSVNGPNTVINTLGVQSAEGRLKWDFAKNTQLGMVGNDYTGIEEIGSAAVERASNNVAIPDFFNFWYPQKQKNDHRSVVYFKRTLVGTITEVGQFIHSGTFEDFDVNIHIRPDPPYQYMITDGHKPEYTNLMKTQHYGSLGYSGSSGCPTHFETVEAEISDKRSPSSGYKSRIVQMNESRVGQKIAVYGPWIWDEGHCCHPEIHPAEQAWWTEQEGNNRKFHMAVFCDASRRFFWRSQMDDGTKLKPWAEPPIKGMFAIAFEYLIPAKAAMTGYHNIKYEVSTLEHHNVIEYPNADQTYNLVYNGNNIVSFVPHNNAFKVSFEHVGISPEDRNKIRGFLVIETSVGLLTQIATSVPIPGSPIDFKLPMGSSPAQAPVILESKFFKKEAGHYYFTVTESVTGGVGGIRDRPIIRVIGQ